MGGILKHAPALSAILAPTVNSYKRLIRGRPRSGATWAPVYITYGSANRTQMIRVPGPGRIENRMVDAAANPYLACAAMLAAGLDGIEHRIDPGVASHDNLYEVPWEELHARGIGHLPADSAGGDRSFVARRSGAQFAGCRIRRILHPGEDGGMGELPQQRQPVGTGPLPKRPLRATDLSGAS